jgi:polar amino acid transport system substrate-binding protein
VTKEVRAMRGLGLPAVLVMLCCGATAGAAEDGAAAGRPMRIGTRHAPPFAIRGSDGTWSGISIDLWEEIAGELGLSYEYREYGLAELLEATRAGEVDAAVAALTVTSERERTMDFTHPLHTTGLSIAVRPGKGGGFWAVARNLLSPAFLSVVGLLALVLLGAGLLVWFFERRRNPAQFGGSAARGIGAGFWWSAVTMTTVGYGDKAPVTLWGRIIALIWMFTALVIVATFTGAMASTLTVTRLEGAIRGPQDLPGVKVGTVADSTSAAYLARTHVSGRPYRSALDGLEAVASGEIDAFVYDAPILKYLAGRDLNGRVAVLPNTFERQDYAIALPFGSRLRKPINQHILRILTRGEWQETLRRYLGR